MTSGWLFQWLRRKEQPEDERLNEAIKITFNTVQGHIVMEWLMVNYYFSVCPTDDALVLARHNGARALIQEILEKYDASVNQKEFKTPEVKV